MVGILKSVKTSFFSMFVKFKQKIAEGSEGVSVGRQTPLDGVPTTDARNTSVITTAEAATQDFASTAIPIPKQQTSPSISRTESSPQKIKSSHNAELPPNRSTYKSSCSDESTDADELHNIANIPLSKLQTLFTKQMKTIERYKRETMELKESNRRLTNERDKLEGALTSDQDKHLQKIKDLRETIDLEVESKRHLDNMLRMELGEKDDLIHVLRTQIHLLKNDRETIGSSGARNPNSDIGGEIIQSLQDRLKGVCRETEKLREETLLAREKLERCEGEKVEAMEKGRKEVQQLRSQIAHLEDELNKKQETIDIMKDQGGSLRDTRFVEKTLSNNSPDDDGEG